MIPLVYQLLAEPMLLASQPQAASISEATRVCHAASLGDRRNLLSVTFSVSRCSRWVEATPC